MLGQAEVVTVLVQPVFQDADGCQEVVALQHHQVDVVGVLAAAEAVGQVILRIDRRFQFAAVQTLKTKIAIDWFPDRPVTPNPSSIRHSAICTNCV